MWSVNKQLSTKTHSLECLYNKKLLHILIKLQSIARMSFSIMKSPFNSFNSSLTVLATFCSQSVEIRISR